MPYDNQSVNDDNLHPQPVFTSCLSGGIGKGKTSLLLKLVLEIYRNVFNRVVCINPSGDLDEKFSLLLSEKFVKKNCALEDAINEKYWDSEDLIDIFGKSRKTKPPKSKPEILPVLEEDFHTDYSVQIIKDLVAEQRSIIKEFGKKLASNVLLIIDDSVSAGAFSKSHQDGLSKAISNCRHLKISVLIATQKFRVVPSIIRENLTSIFFSEASPEELRCIYDIFDLEMEWKDWKALMQRLFTGNYTFVQINLRNKKKMRLIKDLQYFIDYTKKK